MRAGKVVRIRVNPEDCQSVLDLCERVGIPTSGMSYAQCVSVALASLLETARAQKILPKPDPFQFLNRMQPFVDTSHHRKKLEVARTIGELGATFHAPAVPRSASGLAAPGAGRPSAWPAGAEGPAHSASPAPVSADQLRDRSRLTELLQKKDMASPGSGVLWSAQDEEEFQELYQRVYPEG